MKRPRVGIWPMTLNFGAVADEARRMQALGIDSLWAGEETDSLTTAGALAVAAPGAAIGTALAQPGRTPAQLAIACLTLQQLTNNQFHLGIGLVGRPVLEGWHRFPWERRAARFADYLRATRALFAGSHAAPASYQGPYYEVERFASFAGGKTPPPTIWVGASGPKMLEAAGAVGDGVLLINLMSQRYFQETARETVTRAARAAGRDPATIKVGYVRYAAIDSDRAAAQESLRAGIAKSALRDYHQDLLRRSGFAKEAALIAEAYGRNDVAAARAAVSDEMLAAFGVGGTADDLRKQVAAYDADIVLVVPPGSSIGPEATIAQNRAIAEALAD